MKDPISIGTAHFVSIDAANKYYSEYGYTPDDVQQKLDAYEIFIGEPPVKIGEILRVNNEGRYVITYDRAQGKEA